MMLLNIGLGIILGVLGFMGGILLFLLNTCWTSTDNVARDFRWIVFLIDLLFLGVILIVLSQIL